MSGHVRNAQPAASSHQVRSAAGAPPNMQYSTKNPNYSPENDTLYTSNYTDGTDYTDYSSQYDVTSTREYQPGMTRERISIPYQAGQPARYVDDTSMNITADDSALSYGQPSHRYDAPQGYQARGAAAHQQPDPYQQYAQEYGQYRPNDPRAYNDYTSDSQYTDYTDDTYINSTFDPTLPPNGQLDTLHHTRAPAGAGVYAAGRAGNVNANAAAARGQYTVNQGVRNQNPYYEPQDEYDSRYDDGYDSRYTEDSRYGPNGTSYNNFDNSRQYHDDNYDSRYTDDSNNPDSTSMYRDSRYSHRDPYDNNSFASTQQSQYTDDADYGHPYQQYRQEQQRHVNAGMGHSKNIVGNVAMNDSSEYGADSNPNGSELTYGNDTEDVLMSEAEMTTGEYTEIDISVEGSEQNLPSERVLHSVHSDRALHSGQPLHGNLPLLSDQPLPNGARVQSGSLRGPESTRVVQPIPTTITGIDDTEIEIEIEPTPRVEAGTKAVPPAATATDTRTALDTRTVASKPASSAPAAVNTGNNANRNNVANIPVSGGHASAHDSDISIEIEVEDSDVEVAPAQRPAVPAQRPASTQQPQPASTTTAVQNQGRPVQPQPQQQQTSTLQVPGNNYHSNRDSDGNISSSTIEISIDESHSGPSSASYTTASHPPQSQQPPQTHAPNAAVAHSPITSSAPPTHTNTATRPQPSPIASPQPPNPAASQTSSSAAPAHTPSVATTAPAHVAAAAQGPVDVSLAADQFATAAQAKHTESRHEASVKTVDAPLQPVDASSWGWDEATLAHWRALTPAQQQQYLATYAPHMLSSTGMSTGDMTRSRSRSSAHGSELMHRHGYNHHQAHHASTNPRHTSFGNPSQSFSGSSSQSFSGSSDHHHRHRESHPTMSNMDPSMYGYSANYTHNYYPDFSNHGYNDPMHLYGYPGMSPNRNFQNFGIPFSQFPNGTPYPNANAYLASLSLQNTAYPPQMAYPYPPALAAQHRLPALSTNNTGNPSMVHLTGIPAENTTNPPNSDASASATNIPHQVTVKIELAEPLASVLMAATGVSDNGTSGTTGKNGSTRKTDKSGDISSNMDVSSIISALRGGMRDDTRTDKSSTQTNNSADYNNLMNMISRQFGNTVANPGNAPVPPPIAPSPWFLESLNAITASISALSATKQQEALVLREAVQILRERKREKELVAEHERKKAKDDVFAEKRKACEQVTIELLADNDPIVPSVGGEEHKEQKSSSPVAFPNDKNDKLSSDLSNLTPIAYPSLLSSLTSADLPKHAQEGKLTDKIREIVSDRVAGMTSNVTQRLQELLTLQKQMHSEGAMHSEVDTVLSKLGAARQAWAEEEEAKLQRKRMEEDAIERARQLAEKERQLQLREMSIAETIKAMVAQQVAQAQVASPNGNSGSQPSSGIVAEPARNPEKSPESKITDVYADDWEDEYAEEAFESVDSTTALQAMEPVIAVDLTHAYTDDFEALSSSLTDREKSRHKKTKDNGTGNVVATSAAVTGANGASINIGVPMQAPAATTPTPQQQFLQLSSPVVAVDPQPTTVVDNNDNYSAAYSADFSDAHTEAYTDTFSELPSVQGDAATAGYYAAGNNLNYYSAPAGAGLGGDATAPAANNGLRGMGNGKGGDMKLNVDAVASAAFDITSPSVYAADFEESESIPEYTYAPGNKNSGMNNGLGSSVFGKSAITSQPLHPSSGTQKSTRNSRFAMSSGQSVFASQVPSDVVAEEDWESGNGASVIVSEEVPDTFGNRYGQAAKGTAVATRAPMIADDESIVISVAPSDVVDARGKPTQQSGKSQFQRNVPVSGYSMEDDNESIVVSVEDSLPPTQAFGQPKKNDVRNTAQVASNNTFTAGYSHGFAAGNRYGYQDVDEESIAISVE